jgi:drug/metabolite transporter (DMT)-like permease
MPSSNRTGSFYMLLSVICFSMMDILVKLTTSHYPIGEIAFFRGLFGLIPIFFLIPKNKIFTFFKTKKPTLHFIRAFAGTFAMISTFIGVKYMKLADVVSIAQATPVFVTIFSIIFLKEVVGYRRWFSVIAGLIGVLFITKPGTSLFNIYCIFPIFFCIGFSIVAVSIKRLSKTEPDYLIAFYFTALLILVSSTAFFFEEWKMPNILDFFYLCMIGICGSIANLFMTTAYRRADASLITPLKYLSVLSAIFFGYYIFSEIPSVTTIIGAIIIIISSFIIFKREQVKKRGVSL